MEHDLKKRYWVFCCPQFYPCGGLNDVAFTTDDRADALKRADTDDLFHSVFDSDITVRDFITE